MDVHMKRIGCTVKNEKICVEYGTPRVVLSCSVGRLFLPLTCRLSLPSISYESSTPYLFLLFFFFIPSYSNLICFRDPTCPNRITIAIRSSVKFVKRVFPLFRQETKQKPITKSLNTKQFHQIMPLK